MNDVYEEMYSNFNCRPTENLKTLYENFLEWGEIEDISYLTFIQGYTQYYIKRDKEQREMDKLIDELSNKYIKELCAEYKKIKKPWNNKLDFIQEVSKQIDINAWNNQEDLD